MWKNRLQAENVYLQEEITTTHHRGENIGQSRALQEVLRRVAQVASTDATMLIQGETGTGKELIARAVHQHSRYRDQPLVPEGNITGLSLRATELSGKRSPY
jgi:transcriptional regulator with GAF, ATPase, and Fis domain